MSITHQSKFFHPQSPPSSESRTPPAFRRRSLPCLLASLTQASSRGAYSPSACLDDDFLLNTNKSMLTDGNGYDRNPSFLEKGQTPPVMVKVEGGVFDKAENFTITKSAMNTPNMTKRKDREKDGEYCSSYSIKKCVSSTRICFTSPKAISSSSAPANPHHAENLDRRLSTSSSFSSLGLGEDDSFFLKLMGEAQQFDDEGPEAHDDEDSVWSSSSSSNPFLSRDSIGNHRQKSARV